MSCERILNKEVVRWQKQHTASAFCLSLIHFQEPTIISPKQYMRRFRTAIMSYFTVVPGSIDMALPLEADN